MAQPKEPPISIRPGAERQARIEAWAKARGLKRHAAILELIDLGLEWMAERGEPPPPPQRDEAMDRLSDEMAADLARAEIADRKAGASVPFAGDIERRATPKGQKR